MCEKIFVRGVKRGGGGRFSLEYGGVGVSVSEVGLGTSRRVGTWIGVGKLVAE